MTRKLLLGILLPLFVSWVRAESPLGFYRFPALHGDTIVFTAEGDLWRVGVAGGVAQRLTTHPGLEARAAISPDGQSVAFTAEYEGPNEVYVMPLAGGLPTRLTFEGGNARVVAWTPSGRVLYSTESYSDLPNAQLVSLDPRTGARQLLPLAQASDGTYAADEKTLIFTRFTRQGSSTKRYQGGWVENLWRFSEGAAEAEPLTTSFKGTSRDPMWWEGRIYHLSDRSGVMNLWSMKSDGSDLTQHTRHTNYDAQTPALDKGRVVYQLGADLRLLELATGTDRLVEIRLASDFDQQRERWIKKPMEFLSSSHLSPNGDRVVLTARGQVFVAPVESGRLVEVPRAGGVRYRNAQFLPDGKSLLAQTDESGEIEFCRLPANGTGRATLLTTNGTVFRFGGVPSPDGQRVVWTDKDLKLWFHELKSGQTRLIGESRHGNYGGLTWSPDSQWLAYVAAASNTVEQIHLYRPSDNTRAVVTSERVESFSPAWSPDGKWLYFLSDRELRSLVGSPWGPRQPEPFFTEATKIYALALSKGQRWPFTPKDELDSSKAEEKKESARAETNKTETAKAEPDKEKGAKPDWVKVDLEGLATRLFEVPVAAGNYRDLEVVGKHLLWIARDTGFSAKSTLKQLEISNKDPKPKTLVEEIGSYEISHDGKKMLIRKGEAFHVIPSDSPAPAKLDEKVNLDGWTFAITPREEWRQIFTESWRMMRDYFYDRGMHGLDWKAMLQKYLPLVDRVSDRAELNNVIHEMVGELSTLHIYVRYGDERQGTDQVKVAALGARLSRDEAAGGWRVERVYRSDPDYPNQAPPLSAPEVNVGPGDILTAINGRATLAVPHPEMLLRNQAGKQVLLEVKPRGVGTNRQVIVRPISTDREADLRYGEWELSRRESVEQLGRGQIGYVHLRAMGSEDIAQWARNFFPVFNRQGLIIDVRHNRGGNIDSWILEKLLRRAWFYWQPRVGEPTWNMQYAFRGHLTVLCNERTASDGEAFSEGFKRLGLGKVIGTRTWGGEIWLSASRWLVDSGMATAAELGVYGPEGSWLIEGHGVEPDITVDNLPHETFQGRDAQLEAAVKHLQELMARDPRPVPPAPKYPDKSFRP